MIDNVGRKVTLILVALAICVLSLLIGGFRMGLDLQGGTRLRYSIDFDKAVEQEKIRPEELQNKPKLLQDIIAIWRERIDPQGVRDVVIRTEGEDRIVIEMPGNAAQVRRSASGPLGADLEVLDRELILNLEEADLEAFPQNGGQVKIGSETIRYGKRLGNQLLDLSRGYMMTTPSKHELGNAVELTAVDPWRELIENEGSLSFFIAAGPTDLGLGTDLASETEKAKAWVRENYPALPISDYNATFADRAAEGAVSRLRFFPMKKDAETALVADEDLLRAVMLDENPRWQFSGADVHTVFLSQDQLGLPAVGFRMADNKTRDFGNYTEDHEGEAMAIVINDEIVTFPVIEEKLPGRGIIKGGGAGFKMQEVQDLITVLRSGSLRLAPTFEAQESVGATLGGEYVRRGFLSAALGLTIVLAFMMLYYRRLGVFAAISLVCNLILLTGALAFLQATLTLPGVAGIILTVGMAVDANILIYERIREEALRGRKPMQAAKDGFSNALSTIVDANLTTLITGLILYQFGTGPVRGFATTLSIGILTSMFSALVVTRVLVHIQLEKGLDHFSMARFVHDTKIAFMAKARGAMLISGLLIIGGLAAYTALDDEEKLGIDFLGGMTMSVRTAEPETKANIESLVKGIEGVVGESAEIKPIMNSAEGDGYTHFRITAKGTSLGLEEEAESKAEGANDEQASQEPQGDILQEFRGQVEQALAGVIQKGPIEGVDVTDGTASGVLYFEREHPTADLTAELVQIGVDAATITTLTEAGAPAYRFEGTVQSARTPQSLRDQLSSHFQNRVDSLGVSLALASPIDEVNAVGAQVVAELRDDAIFAILLSLFAAVMYIRVRFAEYSFGLAAVAALTHDVLITLGALALADHFVPFIDTEINLPMVAAFLTIIGYSLNDTIVVFDRVRENLPRMKGSLAEIIDKSINQTLSRTLLTSVTTLISVGLLLAFNLGSGNVLEGFAFALLIGVLVGTYSSMFIASPVLLWLETRRQRSLEEDDPTRRGAQVEASAAS